MGPIELKLKASIIFGFFIFFFLLMSAAILEYFEPAEIILVLTIALLGASVSVGTIFAVIFIPQRKIVIGENEIKKIGYHNKSIAYKDIEKMGIAGGGFEIFDDSNNPIRVSTFYSNFDKANELLNEKIKANEIKVSAVKPQQFGSVLTINN